MDVVVVDVGGSHVKVLASGQTQPRRFDSGPAMVPRDMVASNSGDYPRLELSRRFDRLSGTCSSESASRGTAGFGAWVGRFRFRSRFRASRETTKCCGDAGPWGATGAERCCSWA